MKAVFRFIYNLVPFKSAIFSALKLLWTPQESIYRHLHFKGIFTIAIDDRRRFKINHFGYQIENEIFWRGLTNTWEKESIKLWIKLCEESQTILDIGANTGVYSLVAKAVNSNARVYSFEPHPVVYQMLCKNVALNNFDIVTVNKALSNLDGVMLIEDYTGQSRAITTESLTLATFIREHRISKIDLIKIDVEGFEPLVMEGFSNFLFQFKPIMIVEILNTEVGDKIYNFVRDLGYLYFNIHEKGTIRQTDKIEKSDYFNYLLCSPEIAAKLGLVKK